MKYLLVALAITMSATAWAQTSKGSWMIGGGAKIQRQTSRTIVIDYGAGTTTYGKVYYGILELNPSVGYFVKDRLMLGVHADEYRSWAVTGPKNKRQSFSVGPVSRYYFPVAEKLMVFPEIAYLFSNTKQTYDINGDKQTQQIKSTIFRAGAGISWFVSPNIGIEGILAYQDTNSKTSDLGDQQQLYYSVGIQFYLPKKE